jgi:hypothetical protein
MRGAPIDTVAEIRAELDAIRAGLDDVRDRFPGRNPQNWLLPSEYPEAPDLHLQAMDRWEYIQLVRRMERLEKRVFQLATDHAPTPA